MKLVFLTNVMNHYQLALSDAFCRQEDIDFSYIATIPQTAERKKLGFTEMNHCRDYITCSYEGEEEMKKAEELCDSADVLIFGSAPREMYHKREKSGKMVFAFAERIYKNGYKKRELPLRKILYHFRHERYKNKYLLCSSAFLAGDYNRTGNFKGRAYKWGYFPSKKEYDIESLMAGKNNDKISIVWSARYLDWKHPEAPVYLGEYLRKKGYNFEINMIGTGELFDKTAALVAEKQLEDYVILRGSMSPESVREYMEKASIFIFTSDRGEGWGVVLNEAMNSGCAAVAAHDIGSVPYLIDNGKNGIIFESRNWDSLSKKVEQLINDKELREKLGRAAYKTISELWNSDIAAERFPTLVRCINDGKETPYENGPCSKAEILYDDWFKE